MKTPVLDYNKDQVICNGCKTKIVDRRLCTGKNRSTL